MVLVQFYNGGEWGEAARRPTPLLCFAKPDVLRRSCSVLSWGGAQPPPTPPPPPYVWRTQTFLVALVQLYHGGPVYV